MGARDDIGPALQPTRLAREAGPEIGKTRRFGQPWLKGNAHRAEGPGQ